MAKMKSDDQDTNQSTVIDNNLIVYTKRRWFRHASKA